jgi:hypothetical protein
MGVTYVSGRLKRLAYSIPGKNEGLAYSNVALIREKVLLEGETRNIDPDSTQGVLTTDSIDTVFASGYFNRVINKLAIGDEITVTVVDNVNPALRTTLIDQVLLVVTSVASGTVVTGTPGAQLFGSGTIIESWR